MKDKLVRFILRHVVPRLIFLLGRCLRIAYYNEEYARGRGERGESCIFCFWHNRFLLMPFFYRRVREKKNIVVMASLSRDGEFITEVLKGFRFAVARGSSSRGGEGALLEMADLLKRGLDAAVTPDGPRGPLYGVQPGVVLLSQMSGAPIVPASYDFRWKARLRSWDRFMLPIPFSRGAMVFGDPIWVPEDADELERGRARLLLEERLRSLNLEAASVLGIEAG